MRTRLLVSLAALAAALLPATAHAAGFRGVVVAKESHRGTLVIAGRGGTALTVHGRLSLARLGDRVLVGGPRLHDGTLRAATLRVLGHARHATVRGTVVRQLARRTLLSTGHSVIAIQRHAPRRVLASALDDHAQLQPGDVARFEIELEHGVLVQAAATQVGQVGTVEVEGAVVSVSPLVVSVEGLPITIGVPGGTTLPPGLSVGDRVELRVGVAAGNVFTLAAFDEVENEVENEEENEDQVVAEEVEIKGAVISSSASQLVVRSGGESFTFVPPAGVTLPTLLAGTIVEVKANQQNGTLVLARLKVEDEHGDGDHGDNSGPGGGGDHHGDGGSGDGGGGDD